MMTSSPRTFRCAARTFAVGALVLLAAVVLTVSGCGPKKGGPAPVWTNEGPPGSDGEWFYGVGCAPPEISNFFFKRFTARERARVDLATHVNDYLVHELDGDTGSARAALERVLPEHEIADEYLGQDGHLCSLARLPRTRVEEMMNDQ